MGAVDVKSFRELMVWREAVELVVDCYHLAELLPRGERFGIVAQLKRCATSIPANIAEGHGRKRPKAFLNHVHIALGSEAELATHLHVAERLGFCSTDQTRAISKRREQCRPNAQSPRCCVETKDRIRSKVLERAPKT
jgi:four helix bundle protein